MIEAGETTAGLARGARLEALKGDRAGQHGIRINDQWRVRFAWTPRDPGAHQ